MVKKDKYTDIWILSILILINIIIIIAALNTCVGWGCLGVIMLFFPLILMIILMFIFNLYKLIKNKKLSKLRWVLFVLSTVIILFSILSVLPNIIP